MKVWVKEPLLLRKLILICFAGVLCFLTFSAFASKLQLKGEMTQGSLIRGQVPAGHQVWLNDNPLTISPNGFLLLGLVEMPN